MFAIFLDNYEFSGLLLFGLPYSNSGFVGSRPQDCLVTQLYTELKLNAKPL